MSIDEINLHAPRSDGGLTLAELSLVGKVINICTGGGVATAAAAVYTREGAIYSGANLALSIPSSLCAEQVAVAHAHAAGRLGV